MKFGRKRRSAEDEPAAAGDVAGDEETVAGPVTGAGPLGTAPARTRQTPQTGPFDVSEVDLEDDDPDLIDLGSLLLPKPEGLEVRLQVDEQTQQVMSVIVLGQQGALELRAFASSRGGGSWEELRPRIVAETERVGGRATEEEGTFGDELVCLVPVKGPDGQAATQASRISGHEGPTWLLRANLMGNPAVTPDEAGPWEDVIRSVIVRRGAGAMAPGTTLPLTLPPEARRAQPAEAEADLPTGPPATGGA